MARVLLLALTVLLSDAWLQSQDTQSGASQTESAASGQTTLQGCLQGSDGNYALTDKSGRTYQLRSKTSRPAA